jgi:pyruvate,orthophosphate dikinase
MRLTDVGGRARWVFAFAAGSREIRDLFGGKGANVAEMIGILGADLVPAGFTITTEACVAYMEGDRQFPPGLDVEVEAALAHLEQQVGKRLGDPRDPLLVSVRSGARESMLGMMDTVLNLGINDESLAGLVARHGARPQRHAAGLANNAAPADLPRRGVPLAQIRPFVPSQNRKAAHLRRPTP